jgi:threonine dehydrogenase-like Zn-dependent dehydrogenase
MIAKPTHMTPVVDLTHGKGTGPGSRSAYRYAKAPAIVANSMRPWSSMRSSDYLAISQPRRSCRLKSRPQRVLVIGAGPSGLLAEEFDAVLIAIGAVVDKHVEAGSGPTPAQVTAAVAKAIPSADDKN